MAEVGIQHKASHFFESGTLTLGPNAPINVSNGFPLRKFHYSHKNQAVKIAT